jgi:tetratricopeptide (TPR) repeat protein
MIKKTFLIVELFFLSILPPFYSYSRIERICKRKLGKRPADKDVLWILSNLYILYKKYGEAKPYLEALFEMSKDNKDIRFLLARVYYNLNEYEKVKIILQGERFLSPRDKENYYFGNSLLQLKEYQVAIEPLLNYVTYHKEDYVPYLKLGYAYYMQDSFDLAVNAYKKAERLNPKDSKIKESIELCLKKTKREKDC